MDSNGILITDEYHLSTGQWRSTFSLKQLTILNLNFNNDDRDSTVYTALSV